MGKNKSPFDTWFRQQFGPPPKIGISEGIKKVDALKMELYRAEFELRLAEKYLCNKTAALYAWNAKGIEEKEKVKE